MRGSQDCNNLTWHDAASSRTPILRSASWYAVIEFARRLFRREVGEDVLEVVVAERTDVGRSVDGVVLG